MSNLKWTGNQVSGLSLNDHLMPWVDEQPVVVAHPERPERWVVVFSTPQKLDDYMDIYMTNLMAEQLRAPRQRVAGVPIIGVPSYNIKKINDGREFLASIWSGGLHVMLDPHFKDGKTKFHWVVPEGKEVFKEF